LYSWIRDPDSGYGMKKIAQGSGMNIPDFIFKTLVSVFGLNLILTFFNADPDPFLVNPGSGMGKITKLNITNITAK
jgi:hypothetical protein